MSGRRRHGDAASLQQQRAQSASSEIGEGGQRGRGGEGAERDASHGERMEGRGRERLTWPDELLVGGSAERKTSERELPA